MLALAARRLIVAIPTLLAIVAAAFVLMHAAPGGPFTKERQVPPEIERRLEAKYGLDLPLGATARPLSHAAWLAAISARP